MADTQSEFHDITKPEKGKTDYSQDYYNFVDQVDANLKLSGAIADRPTTANAPDNAWYEATDQNLIYRNDPTNGWIVIGHGNENNPVPEGQYESLSAGESNATRRRSDSASGPFETASKYATGGTGASSNFYTGTPIRDAIDAVQANGHSAASKEVFVDGQFDESVSIPSANGLVLSSPNWNSQIRPQDTGYGFDIGDGTKNQADVQIKGLTVRSPDTKSIRLNKVDEVQILETHINHGLTAIDSDNVWVMNGCETSNNDFELRGCSEWWISDFFANLGSIIRFTDDNGTETSDITLGSIYGDGSAVEIANASGISGGPLVIRGAFNNISINGASDCSLLVDSVTDRNDAVNVVNGENISIFGHADGTGGNAGVEFQSGATECVFYGTALGGTINNGTRCVINGRSVNAGDPNTTGDWNGFHSLALSLGIIIEDTTNSNLYYPKSDGAFSQIGS